MAGLPHPEQAAGWQLCSPELDRPRSVDVQAIVPGRLRFSVDLTGIRLYALVASLAEFDTISTPSI